MTDEQAHQHSPRVQYVNGQLMRVFADRLKERGLNVRQVTYSDKTACYENDVEEIVVINPAAPERGDVRVGDDGCVTWEYWSRIEPEDDPAGLIDTIMNVLAPNRDHEHSGSPEPK